MLIFANRLRSIYVIETEEIDVRIIVKKWGNSAAVRIPAAIMETMCLRLDESVDVREEGGRIVIEPVNSREYDLDQLLDGITPENLQDQVSFGAAVGRESF